VATPEEIAQLRLLIGTTNLNDDQLGAILDAEGSIEGAAAAVWESKAASSATLVNVSESGSSRSLSDVHKNALAMAKYWRGQDEIDSPDNPETRPSRTRAIERA